MSLTCGISNEVPEVPVLSPVSGTIFEKRLIVKYIQENQVDPINGEELGEDQLIEIKIPALVKPKAPSSTSIPALLKSMQDEWDAVMLNSYTVRQQLQTARQELSHALYQHDAACRVIARLTKEVTAAREALATLKPKGAHVVSGKGDSKLSESEEETGITPAIVQKLESKAAVLTAERKKRGKGVAEGLATADDIKGFKTLASHSGLHSASIPGLVCLDVCPTDTNKIVTGGNDKIATVFNRESEQIVCQLKGHSKKVSSVIFHPNRENVITGSPDSQIRVWNLGSAQTSHLIRAHEGPVTALSLHATGDFLLSTSTDEHWVFSDVTSGKIVTKAGDIETPHALTTAQFHPDGLIFATGTSDSLIKIWDLKEKSNVANFTGHSGHISAIAFSENGYYLATSAADSTVKLWDLRKLKNFKTLVLDDGYEVKDVCFDTSGSYLAIAGSDVRVYVTKQWDTIKTFSDHTSLVTGVRFGANAQFVLSSGLDRTLKIYGA